MEAHPPQPGRVAQVQKDCGGAWWRGKEGAEPKAVAVDETHRQTVLVCLFTMQGQQSGSEGSVDFPSVSCSQHPQVARREVQAHIGGSGDTNPGAWERLAINAFLSLQMP